MQLEVSIYLAGASVPGNSWMVTELDQAEKIGHQIGRAVRDFIRSSPLRIGGSRMRFEVACTWRDGAKPDAVKRDSTTKAAAMKPRRKKRAK